MMACLRKIAGAPGRTVRLAVRESVLTALAFVGGLALVAAGVGMVHLPSGLIVAGVELTTTAVLYGRGLDS